MARRAQRTVDDAEMKYVVVHLHRLLEPEAADRGRAPSGPAVPPQQQRALQQQPGNKPADMRRGREQHALPRPPSQPTISCSAIHAASSHRH